MIKLLKLKQIAKNLTYCKCGEGSNEQDDDGEGRGE